MVDLLAIGFYGAIRESIAGHDLTFQKEQLFDRLNKMDYNKACANIAVPSSDMTNYSAERLSCGEEI